MFKCQIGRSLLFVCVWSFLCFFSVQADTLSVSASPSAFNVTTATAGQNPAALTNTSTKYNVSTTTTIRSITGKISSNMPSGVALTVQLQAPAGGTSAGAVTMTSVAANLVTAIPKITTATNLLITYTFTATVSAAQVASATKTLTLTLQ